VKSQHGCRTLRIKTFDSESKRGWAQNFRWASLVTFATVEEAVAAVEQMNGAEFELTPQSMHGQPHMVSVQPSFTPALTESAAEGVKGVRSHLAKSVAEALQGKDFVPELKGRHLHPLVH